MPLPYQPKESTVLICDFNGFIAPEMVKSRPVVILRKHKHNSRLVTVVPLSTTPPSDPGPHHVLLPCFPPKANQNCWAKCDMIYTVSLDRLDRIMTRDRSGKRIYQAPLMDAADFEAVKAAVRAGLGF